MDPPRRTLGDKRYQFDNVVLRSGNDDGDDVQGILCKWKQAVLRER